MVSQHSRFIIYLAFSGAVISSNDQKRFDKFILLGLPKFCGTMGKDDNTFLTNWQEKLHNLRE